MVTVKVSVVAMCHFKTDALCAMSVEIILKACISCMTAWGNTKDVEDSRCACEPSDSHAVGTVHAEIHGPLFAKMHEALGNKDALETPFRTGSDGALHDPVHCHLPHMLTWTLAEMGLIQSRSQWPQMLLSGMRHQLHPFRMCQLVKWRDGYKKACAQAWVAPSHMPSSSKG